MVLGLRWDPVVDPVVFGFYLGFYAGFYLGFYAGFYLGFYAGFYLGFYAGFYLGFKPQLFWFSWPSSSEKPFIIVLFYCGIWTMGSSQRRDYIGITIFLAITQWAGVDHCQHET